MELYIQKLEEIQDGNKTDPVLNKTIDIFLAAVQDWPNPVLTLEDFETEISIFINGVATKDKINTILKVIDFSKNAWQAESLQQLTEVFQYYQEGMSIKEIIEDIKIKLL